MPNVPIDKRLSDCKRAAAPQHRLAPCEIRQDPQDDPRAVELIAIRLQRLAVSFYAYDWTDVCLNSSNIIFRFNLTKS